MTADELNDLRNIAALGVVGTAELMARRDLARRDLARRQVPER